MEQAAMNMVMGMGTVFIVLIFISFLIGCFKYINRFEEKMKNKGKKEDPEPLAAAEPAPAAVVQAAEENLADDLELVAVITAAIAASTGTSQAVLSYAPSDVHRQGNGKKHNNQEDYHHEELYNYS